MQPQAHPVVVHLRVVTEQGSGKEEEKEKQPNMDHVSGPAYKLSPDPYSKPRQF